MNNSEIESLFDEWNNALQTGTPKKVSALYDKEGVLLPTLSNQVRHNHDEIEDYFASFLAKKPSGQIDESNIRIFDNIAINSGIYTFTFGDNSTARTRFTYVYRKTDQDWLIIEHHSSVMPE